MPNLAQIRPDPTEYFSYYHKYVQLVPESEIVQAISSDTNGIISMF